MSKEGGVRGGEEWKGWSDGSTGSGLCTDDEEGGGAGRRVRLEAEPRAATIPFSGYTSYTS